MRQTYLKISLLFFAFASLISCDKNQYQVDLTGIESNLKVIRLETQLAQLSEDGFESQIDKIKAENPELSEVLIEQVIRAGSAQNPNFKVLKRFFLDSNYFAIANDVKAKYSDFGKYEVDLNDAFKHIKYYFPNETMPEKAYTLITGFSVPGFTYENLVAISLDWYMGQGYEYYHNQVFPMYMQRRMSEEYIVPQVVKAWFSNKYPLEENTDGTLLSEMIYWGKMLEFTKMMMPNVADSVIIEYTSENMKWCYENEGMIYQHFVDRNLWYNTNQNETYRYVSDGPYTIAPNVPIESAPRIGWFLGWQIVRNAIKNSKPESKEDFFADNDYQAIFKNARYKP